MCGAIVVPTRAVACHPFAALSKPAIQQNFSEGNMKLIDSFSSFIVQRWTNNGTCEVTYFEGCCQFFIHELFCDEWLR